MTDVQYDGRDLEIMSFAQNYHAWILSLFKKYLGKHVAEVGAGTGSFTELLLQTPVESLVAVEPSSEMYERFVENTKQEPRVTSHNDVFSNIRSDYQNSFDSVVYVNVLEHVEDDAQELKYIHESLRDGGHVCIFVPALPWLYSKHDAEIGHFRRYTKKELKEKVTHAGFEIERIGYFDMVGILPWFLVFVLLKSSAGSGAVGLYDRVVVPIMRVVEFILMPPIGKNLFIVAKKQTSYSPSN